MCAKCGGSGYIPEYKHIQDGICFLCKGSGEIETKIIENKSPKSFDTTSPQKNHDGFKNTIKNNSINGSGINLEDERSLLQELERSLNREKENQEEEKHDESYLHSFFSDDEYLENEE